MSNEIELQPIWTRGLFFKVYRMGKELTYSGLLENITKYSGDKKTRKQGWLVTYPYFTTDDNNFVSFLYISFKKNTKLSELEGKEVLEHEYIGFVFDFEERLILVSTTNASKLNSLVEEKAFEPINNLCEIHDYRYSGDFFFWLAYMNDINNGNINKNIVIKKISAISSSRESFNLSEAVSTNGDISDILEAKVILGLNKSAKVIKMYIDSCGEIYELNLVDDGRIRAKYGKRTDSIEEKATYAKNIHNIIQNMYLLYKNVASSPEWEIAKDSYSSGLIKTGIEELKQCIYEST